LISLIDYSHWLEYSVLWYFMFASQKKSDGTVCNDTSPLKQSL
jgi:hypothetical protein